MVKCFLQKIGQNSPLVDLFLLDEMIFLIAVFYYNSNHNFYSLNKENV